MKRVSTKQLINELYSKIYQGKELNTRLVNLTNNNNHFELVVMIYDLNCMRIEVFNGHRVERTKELKYTKYIYTLKERKENDSI